MAIKNLIKKLILLIKSKPIEFLIVILSCTFLLFSLFPMINVRFYNIYIYDLSSIQIYSKTYNFFSFTFGETYFGKNMIGILIIAVQLGILVLSIFNLKKSNKIILYSLTLISVLLMILLSFYSTIIAKIHNIKTHEYVLDVIDRFPTLPILFEQTHINKESFLIDLGVGQFCEIVSYSLISFVCFLKLFFLNKDNKNNRES